MERFHARRRKIQNTTPYNATALVSPVFVYLLLTRISGLPMLERRAKKRWGDDEAYQAYVRSTPVLIPRPPRG